MKNSTIWDAEQVADSDLTYIKRELFAQRNEMQRLAKENEQLKKRIDMLEKQQRKSSIDWPVSQSVNG